MKKQTLKGCLTLGVALGAMTMTQPAQAGHEMMGKGAMMASQPMRVTGKVNNYWTDASGYVTGMDIQTANGPAVVHFVPGMGTPLMQTYPIGSTANVWVQDSMQDGTQHWDLVGVGDKQPAAGFWPVMEMSGLDIATDWPQIVNGSERVTVEGKLRRVAVDKMGCVIGLIVDTKMISKGAPVNHFGVWSRGETIWHSDGMMMGDKMGGKMGGSMMGGNQTLIRVGPYNGPAHGSGEHRTTPLLVGDEITATGYMEAPRYGALSPYSQRLIGSAVAVNARSVGQMGFPKMKVNEPVILGFNLNLPLITGKAPDALQVVPGGYEVYNGSSGMMNMKK